MTLHTGLHYIEHGFSIGSVNHILIITCSHGVPPSRPILAGMQRRSNALGENLRRRTGVCCRLHDLRHTFATGLAERGVPESTMLALMGHMSRAMLERYSHIRMAAKREAVAGATLRPRGGNSEVLPV